MSEVSAALHRDTGMSVCRHDGEPWPCATRQRDEARGEVDRLRALLARAKDHIDPNDSQAALDLLRECEEAVR